MKLFEHIEQELKHSHKQIRIIFPEGISPKIKEVALSLKDTNIKPILVYDKESDIQPEIKSAHIETLVVEKQDLNHLADFLVELRKGKETKESALKLVHQRHYFATLMVKQGKADGMVGGIDYASKDILRAALQVIKTKPGLTVASSAMIMEFKDENFIFSDISLNLYPSAEELVQIAHHSVEFAKMLGIHTPQVAFLSYSTLGSGAGDSVEKVKQAATAFKAQYPNVIADGEFQFDSAINEATRAKKAPNSPIKGRANVYVFPNIDAGNIGYKIAQQFGQGLAVGPILLGLDKPVNDLSRGASVQDIVFTAKITAFIALKSNK